MTKRISNLGYVAALFALSAGSQMALAGISAEQAARLGQDLTPLGAEQAGNEDGTIPPWEGGLTSPADAGFPDFQSGGHHPDPFADDQVVVRIDASNMDQYADRLTEGYKAMMEAYDTFYINVYPTHRSAAFPRRIYDATKQVSQTAQLSDDGNGFTGATVGIPFPIPGGNLDAIQVMWNHIVRFRGDTAQRVIGQAAMTRGGSYNMVRFRDEFNVLYSHEGITEAELNNVILFFIQQVTAPARLAGDILLVHETLDQNMENRRAWLYNAGQRRVRRAPNVAFDNPGTAADGLRTSDQFDLYNGSPERYNWTLVGKKEMYVPYNSYLLHSNKLTYDEILTPLHLNPEYPRYELHRVWVVDSVLKPGMRHVYKRRTFYVDEDSWQILAVDCYDARDQIWRIQEGHAINYYDQPTYWYTLEVTVDLQSGRYLALGLDNEESATYNFDIERTAADYAPAALRRLGAR